MTEDTSHITPPKSRPLAIRFDWRDWLPYLEDCDLPDDKKRAFIESLHAIVLSCVDLGFNLNPAQKTCGEVIDLKAVLEAAVLNSEHSCDQREGGTA